MTGKFFRLPVLLLFFSCGHDARTGVVVSRAAENDAPYIHAASVISEIPLPHQYRRSGQDEGSFAAYLGKIKLKENKTVYLFNGEQKQNQSAQYAVLDIPVGQENLQQCADAVMRLRAEYLYTAKRFDKIFLPTMQEKPIILRRPATGNILKIT